MEEWPGARGSSTHSRQAMSVSSMEGSSDCLSPHSLHTLTAEGCNCKGPQCSTICIRSASLRIAISAWTAAASPPPFRRNRRSSGPSILVVVTVVGLVIIEVGIACAIILHRYIGPIYINMIDSFPCTLR